jgi:polysaccharide biosynthesis transport protein
MSSDFDYKKYLQLIGKRKVQAVVVALLVMTGAVVMGYLLPKKFEAQSTVFIEKSIMSDLLKGIAVSPTVEEKINVLTYAMNSRTLILKVLGDLDLDVGHKSDAKLEDMVKSFQKNMTIKVRDKEGLFIISYIDKDPKLATDYVNGLVRRYIEENVSKKREESYGASTFLTEQIKVFKERIEKADVAINEFKRQKGALLAVESGNVLVDISTAQQRMDEIRSREAQLESQRALVKKMDSRQGKLVAMQRRLNDLRTEYTDNYPEVVKLKSDMESLREEMRTRPNAVETSIDQERIDYELQGLRRAAAIQGGSLASSRGMLQQMPAVRAELARLEQERNNQVQLYEQLVNRQGQSEISKQLEVQDKATTFRVIDPAVVPMQPISPDRIKIILLGIVAGLAAGIGIALLLDQIDNSVKGIETLKALGVPVLAVVPTIRNPEELALRRKKNRKLFLAAGAYFSLILAVLVYEVLHRYVL